MFIIQGKSFAKNLVLKYIVSWQIDSLRHISFTGTLSAEICFTSYETSLRLKACNINKI